jgi:solute carrier family 8 (sodium/calcium exchanger)
VNACMLHPSKDEETGEIVDVSSIDTILHFFAIGWKVIFSAVPPNHIWGGWACFIVSLSFIGAITAIVGEVAGLMGCVIGLKPGVTAITFVAIGTSLPDTFASKKAASEDRWADSAVGNITGSNAVNVFLGLGLPWVIAVSYYQQSDPPMNYHVPTKGLDVTVASFLCCSFVAISILLIRRCLFKGELGGSGIPRILSAIFLASLWVIYIVINILA